MSYRSLSLLPLFLLAPLAAAQDCQNGELGAFMMRANSNTWKPGETYESGETGEGPVLATRFAISYNTDLIQEGYCTGQSCGQRWTLLDPNAPGMWEVADFINWGGPNFPDLTSSSILYANSEGVTCIAYHDGSGDAAASSEGWSIDTRAWAVDILPYLTELPAQ